MVHVRDEGTYAFNFHSVEAKKVQSKFSVMNVKECNQ
ncbi:uncharacterized protein METZ01_LOCUS367285 [marine metagenome]|uniref:Uncharacterized protein n=1 Tax=marine metagenome TaxID=408172 RepID=A0A382SZQ7_9ZZZZ